MKQLCLCLAFILVLSGTALAEATFPSKEIQVIVPFGPGGSNDVATRLLLKTYNTYLPKDAVVINIAGAGGAVGSRDVRDSKPDGYKLLSFNTIFSVLNLMGSLNFNYKDMTIIGEFAYSDTGLFVLENSPYKSMLDLVTAAKHAPGKIRVGVGFGTLAHLGIMALEQKAGIKLKIVDAGGGEQKAAALMGSHIDAYFEPVPPVVQYLEAKKFRALGIFSQKRNDAYNDIPTMREQGIDLILMQNYGLFGPKGLPQNVVKTLQAALQQTCDKIEFKQELAKNYLYVDLRMNEAAIKLLDDEFTMLKSVADAIMAAGKK